MGSDELDSTALTCWIYRSPRKEGMYLYLKEEGKFDLLPAPLLQRFGKPELVLELEIHPDRKLAREDVNKVLKNLQIHGFHLQLPPDLKPERYYQVE